MSSQSVDGAQTQRGPRDAAIYELAAAIARDQRSHVTRVAVDGRTACGKTTLADELALALRGSGRHVIRCSIDGFHRPRAERYARGRNSPEGYYYDARDLRAIRSLLLDPLGPTGDGMYRTSSFDLDADAPLEEVPAEAAPASGILIVDGTFLLRAELADAWDVTLFIHVTEDVAATRGIARDQSRLGGLLAATELYAQRYRPAFALYDHAARPRETADIVVDNTDLTAPRVTFRVR